LWDGVISEFRGIKMLNTAINVQPNELVPALEKAINHQGTAIVDIMIDSFENI
jgi:thiamine pyrophosphate-dependent acetolactate synthase large subunit-like protein